MILSPDALATTDAPMHVRLDRCVAALPPDSERYGVPRIDARGRLLIGYCCPAEFRWWERGGIAVSDALAAACATSAVVERYAHVTGLDAVECAREMDRLDCGGVHLEGWTEPEREPGFRNSRISENVNSEEQPGKTIPAAVQIGRRSTAKERREAAGEVDMLAGVAG